MGERRRTATFKRRARYWFRRLRKNAKPISCLALSFLFFQSSVLTVYAAEANLWEQRRRAAQKLKERPTLAESLSDVGVTDSRLSRAGLTPEQYQLLAQLPRAASFDMGVHENVPISGEAALQRVTQGVPEAVQSSDSRPRTPDSRRSHSEYKDSPTWLSTLILPYGAIRDLHLSSRPDAPFIIHLQDAHEIAEAQKNIAAMIQGLREERGIHLVGLEGAQGGFALEPYRAYEDKAVTQGIADYFLKEGYIGGPEFAGITSENPPLLWGVEDLADYESNIQAFKDSVKYKPVVHAFLREAEREAERLKATSYSPELKEFDRHFSAYKNRQEPLGDYVRYLLDTYPDSRRGYTNLYLLMSALDWESALDFKEVEKERMALVELFAKKLTNEQLSLLVQQSLQYRLGHMGYGDYYRFLRHLCQSNGIDLEGFGQLKSYINYVLLAERINRNDLLVELGDLEQKTQDSLARRPDQKRLVAAHRNLLILQKLTGHNMTPADWLYYERNKAQIHRVPAELSEVAASIGTGTDLVEPPSFAEFLRPFEEFCTYALQRNHSLIENLLTKMQSEKATRAVLVAGGFHSDGLTQLLRSRDISYVVVTPKISEVPDDTHYLDVFAHDPLPLERLFSGEVVNLKYWLLLQSFANGLPQDVGPRLNAYRGLFLGLTLLSVEGKDSAEIDTIRRTLIDMYEANGWGEIEFDSSAYDKAAGDTEAFAAADITINGIRLTLARPHWKWEGDKALDYLGEFGFEPGRFVSRLEDVTIKGRSSDYIVFERPTLAARLLKRSSSAELKRIVDDFQAALGSLFRDTAASSDLQPDGTLLKKSGAETPSAAEARRTEDSPRAPPLTIEGVFRLFSFLPERVVQVLVAPVVEIVWLVPIAVLSGLRLSSRADRKIDQFLNKHGLAQTAGELSRRRMGIRTIVRATGSGFILGAVLALVGAASGVYPGGFIGSVEIALTAGGTAVLGNIISHSLHNLRFGVAPLMTGPQRDFVEEFSQLFRSNKDFFLSRSGMFPLDDSTDWDVEKVEIHGRERIGEGALKYVWSVTLRSDKSPGQTRVIGIRFIKSGTDYDGLDNEVRARRELGFFEDLSNAVPGVSLRMGEMLNMRDAREALAREKGGAGKEAGDTLAALAARLGFQAMTFGEFVPGEDLSRIARTEERDEAVGKSIELLIGTWLKTALKGKVDRPAGILKPTEGIEGPLAQAASASPGDILELFRMSGFTIGDMKPENFVRAADGRVVFIDLDHGEYAKFNEFVRHMLYYLTRYAQRYPETRFENLAGEILFPAFLSAFTDALGDRARALQALDALFNSGQLVIKGIPGYSTKQLKPLFAEWSERQAGESLARTEPSAEAIANQVAEGRVSEAVESLSSVPEDQYSAQLRTVAGNLRARIPKDGVSFEYFTFTASPEGKRLLENITEFLVQVQSRKGPLVGRSADPAAIGEAILRRVNQLREAGVSVSDVVEALERELRAGRTMAATREIPFYRAMQVAELLTWMAGETDSGLARGQLYVSASPDREIVSDVYGGEGQILVKIAGNGVRFAPGDAEAEVLVYSIGSAEIGEVYGRQLPSVAGLPEDGASPSAVRPAVSTERPVSKPLPAAYEEPVASIANVGARAAAAEAIPRLESWSDERIRQWIDWTDAITAGADFQTGIDTAIGLLRVMPSLDFTLLDDIGPAHAAVLREMADAVTEGGADASRARADFGRAWARLQMLASGVEDAAAEAAFRRTGEDFWAAVRDATLREVSDAVRERLNDASVRAALEGESQRSAQDRLARFQEEGPLDLPMDRFVTDELQSAFDVDAGRVLSFSSLEQMHSFDWSALGSERAVVLVKTQNDDSLLPEEARGDYRVIVDRADRLAGDVGRIWNGRIGLRDYEFLFEFDVDGPGETVHFDKIFVTPSARGRGVAGSVQERFAGLVKEKFDGWNLTAEIVQEGGDSVRRFMETHFPRVADSAGRGVNLSRADAVGFYEGRIGAAGREGEEFWAYFGRDYLDRVLSPLFLRFFAQADALSAAWESFLQLLPNYQARETARALLGVTESRTARQAIEDFLAAMSPERGIYELTQFVFGRAGLAAASTDEAKALIPELEDALDAINENLGLGLNLNDVDVIRGPPVEGVDASRLLGFANRSGRLRIMISPAVLEHFRTIEPATPIHVQLTRAILHEALEFRGLRHEDIQSMGFRDGGLTSLPDLWRAFRSAPREYAEASLTSPLHFDENHDTVLRVAFNGLFVAGVLDGSGEDLSSRAIRDSFMREEGAGRAVLRTIRATDDEAAIRRKVTEAVVAANNEFTAKGDPAATTASFVVLVPRNNGETWAFVANFGDSLSFVQRRGADGNLELVEVTERDTRFLGIAPLDSNDVQAGAVTRHVLEAGAAVALLTDGAADLTGIDGSLAGLANQLVDPARRAAFGERRRADDATAVLLRTGEGGEVREPSALEPEHVSSAVRSVELQDVLLGGTARSLSVGRLDVSMTDLRTRTLENAERSAVVREQLGALFRGAADSALRDRWLEEGASVETFRSFRDRQSVSKEELRRRVAASLALSTGELKSEENLLGAVEKLFRSLALMHSLGGTLSDEWAALRVWQESAVGERAPRDAKRAADVELLLRLSGGRLKEMGFEEGLQGLAERAQSAYNEMMARIAGVKSASDSFRADPGLGDARFGHAVEVSVNMVSGRRGEFSAEENTAFEKIRALGRQLAETPGTLNASNQVVIVIRDTEGALTDVPAALLRQLADRAGADGQALLNGLRAGKINVVLASTRSALLNDRGQVLAPELVRQFRFERMNIFALAQDHWELGSLQDQGVVTLLLMLAGNVVKDVSREIADEIEFIGLMQIQA